MITKIKPVYYCEFCKKHYFVKSVAVRHEEHCTLNPDRLCNMCKRGSTYDFRSLAHLIISEIYFKDEYDEGYRIQNVIKMEDLIKNIRDEVDNCPACMLTVMRLAGKGVTYFLTDYFNYEEECKKWWAEINEENERRDSGMGYYL